MASRSYFWLRVVLESGKNYYDSTKTKVINLYLPKNVYEDLKIHYPSIDYLVNILKVAKIHFIEHWETINIDDIEITAVWFSWDNSHTY